MTHTNKVIIIAVGTLLLACSVAHAANWVSVGAADNGKHEDLIDLASVRISGTVRTVWTKSLYKKHSLKPAGTTKWVARVLARTSFNCENETSYTESSVVYFEDETNTMLPATSGWQPVPPETVLAAEMNYVCAIKQ
jgi:hypothetical protein